MAVQTANDRSVSELVQQLSTQTGDLVREELRLAQLEMQEKGKRVGFGAGFFGGAGLVGLLALTGKKQVDQALPLAPEQAIETTKQDVDYVKARAAK